MVNINSNAMDINRRQTDDIILDLHNERDSAFKSLLQTGDGSDGTLLWKDVSFKSIPLSLRQ